ncbi:DUF7427 family protein [Tsukamurella soli]|uniref:Uncharacterized protein n=1 Tax=Tsukamurella soli TaxID=644556 RepID=A0ABP8JJS3_9ACTN
MTGKQAWAVLGLGIVTYEAYAVRSGNKLLSEVVDEWLETRPVLTHAAVLLLAGHLLNFPERLHVRYADPVHLLALAVGATKG